jgi:hypothetical protein
MAPGAITSCGLAARNGFVLRTTKPLRHDVTLLIVRINRLYIAVTDSTTPKRVQYTDCTLPSQTALPQNVFNKQTVHCRLRQHYPTTCSIYRLYIAFRTPHCRHRQHYPTTCSINRLYIAVRTPHCRHRQYCPTTYSIYTQQFVYRTKPATCFG